MSAASSASRSQVRRGWGARSGSRDRKAPAAQPKDPEPIVEQQELNSSIKPFRQHKEKIDVDLLNDDDEGKNEEDMTEQEKEIAMMMENVRNNRRQLEDLKSKVSS